MAAIAGIALPNAEETVKKMLDRMNHRGHQGVMVKANGKTTIGVCWPAGQSKAGQDVKKNGAVEDWVSDSHYARAEVSGDSFKLTRDPLGVAPLYFGYTKEQALCFASEVKGLVDLVNEVHELPPSSTLENGKIQTESTLSLQEPVDDHRLSIAAELRRRLTDSVKKRAGQGVPYGAWLSGGLDSSIMAVLARPYIDKFHTFAAGFKNAPDLEFAQLVAKHIQSEHHEMVPTFKDIVKAIPEVIYYLESFDALLVRSSVMNYLVAKMASDFVPAVFSGEGGDELFAGYDYLKKFSLDDLPSELIDITNRLHNTALQRVDRCSAAHGTIAFVGFLDGEVVDYALRIPAEYKIYNGLEKWILRRAVYDLLPERVLRREKAKFWEGAGVQENIAGFVEDQITDQDFQQERRLPNGDELRSKEELYYFRIFQEQFSSLKSFDWMGRTKKLPES